MITMADHTVYPSKSPKYTPADAYLAAAFLYPQIITSEETFPATVELHGSLTRGQVVVDHMNTTVPNAVFIETINQTQFQDLLILAASYTGTNGFVPPNKH